MAVFMESLFITRILPFMCNIPIALIIYSTFNTDLAARASAENPAKTTVCTAPKVYEQFLDANVATFLNFLFVYFLIN